MQKDEVPGYFRIDEVGIPLGKCVDCKHCKFRYKDDNWHCELIQEKHEKCRFELE